MTDEPIYLKFLFLGLLFVMVTMFWHSEAVQYRQGCPNAIKTKQPDYEVTYECRYTAHPEKDSYWLDWTVFGGSKDVPFQGAPIDPVTLKQ